jgi:hypothetical protein
MLGTFAFTFLLVAPAASGNVLTAAVGEGDDRQFQFTSDWVDKGPKQGAVITETITNFRTDTWRTYHWHLGNDLGRLPTAEKNKDGKAVPRSMTMVRTTHRRVEEVSDNCSSACWSRDFGFSEEASPANRWREANPGPWAEPGRVVLEAKLIEGDENGKVMVRCASDVTGDKDKGYTYTNTVENLSDKPVQFKWAGFEGKIEPGKSFIKSLSSKEQTREESGLAEFDFGDHREFTVPAVFAIRANLWARPK